MSGDVLPKRPRNFQDLTGRRFGRLVVKSYAGRDKQKRAVWRCRCDCGGESTVKAWNLKSGGTRSCGCLHPEVVSVTSATHGHTRDYKYTKAYTAWLSIKRRCLSPRCPDYHLYGGRGITVCERWAGSFEAFLEDMGEPPPGTSIDRIDNARGYEPGNCRWATVLEQANNKRSNARLALNGRTQTLAEWCRELGLPRKSVHARLKAGWPHERALTEPIDTTRRNRRGLANGPS